MSPDTFPFHDSVWHRDDSTSRQWIETLEKTGAANVRARLATTDAGPAGAFSIGIVNVMTIGFAQEWLNWKDNQKAVADIERHERQIRWTKTAAIAASIAALSAVAGWVWTVFVKHP